MAKSLKSNYIFNLINTVSGLLFPIITFPYISRIMLADGVGKINFLNSVITYVTLFSCLGIPLYAIREIAKIRDDRKQLSITSTEILLLHLVLTLLGYVAVVILAMFVSKINADLLLFMILSTTIILTTIGCDWLYKGVEDFKYITIRGLIVKCFSVILLFSIVKNREDIVWYAVYIVAVSLGGNIFNFIRLRKYIHLRDFDFSELKPLRHLKPALHIFALNLITSIYVNLDTIMLGFRKDEAAVGFYTAAIRVSKMSLAIVTSLGAVLLPRFSNLIAKGEMKEFRRLARNAIRYIIELSLPLCLAIIILSPSIITLFCGESYIPSITTLRIMSPIILIIGLSGILGMQILYPQGQENKVIISTAVGAVINLVLNWFLIPIYAQDGAAVATLVAESAVTITMIAVGRKYLPNNVVSYRIIHYIIAALLMVAMLLFVNYLDLTHVMTIVTSLFLGTIVYFSYLYAVKDEFVYSILRFIKK